jgi:hypothetical protein
MSEELAHIASEAIEIGAKTALSVIPIGGPLMTSIWDSIKANCAQKRLEEWQELVETRLTSLELTLEDVGENENFTSAIFQATEIAIKTAEREKRVFLANAVRNALTCPFEESIIMMFFSMMDKYTLWHLKILDFFQNPKKFEAARTGSYYMGSPQDVLFDVYPELQDKKPYVKRIVKELYADGLMNTESLDCTMTASGMVASRVTEMGDDFIGFITEQI